MNINASNNSNNHGSFFALPHNGPTTLIVAHSNAAVDNTIESVEKRYRDLEGAPRLLRLGYGSNSLLSTKYQLHILAEKLAKIEYLMCTHRSKQEKSPDLWTFHDLTKMLAQRKINMNGVEQDKKFFPTPVEAGIAEQQWSLFGTPLPPNSKEEGENYTKKCLVDFNDIQVDSLWYGAKWLREMHNFPTNIASQEPDFQGQVLNPFYNYNYHAGTWNNKDKNNDFRSLSTSWKS